MRQRRENGGRIRYLLPAEEEKLRSKILSQANQDELTISLGTGMRLGEQYGLFWKQVDFKRKEIHLDDTKNGSPRDIPMNTDVVAAFQRWNAVTGGRSEDRVFNLDNPRIWFEQAREEAKLKDYVWHSNRHTFCSRLVMAGVGLKTVQVLAGHKTISMTARYSHLAPNTLHSAVELLTSQMLDCG